MLLNFGRVGSMGGYPRGVSATAAVIQGLRIQLELYLRKSRSVPPPASRSSSSMSEGREGTRIRCNMHMQSLRSSASTPKCKSGTRESGLHTHSQLELRALREPFSYRVATPISSRPLSDPSSPSLFSLTEAKGRLLKMATVRFLPCTT